MTTPRFFAQAVQLVGTRFVLPRDVAHHAAHVLRLRDGASIVLFNGRGGEYRARLAERGTQADVLEHDPVERESPIQLTLVQAWIATDKLDWVVEKSVELGVSRLIFAPAQRAVVRLDGARRERRLEHLRQLVLAACCQCGRNRVPSIEAADSLADALRQSAVAGVRGMVLHPEASIKLIEAARTGEGRFALAVGPEGGFDDKELAIAHEHGYGPVRMGPRVLRTETAGPAALAALQAIVGDYR